VKLFRGKGGGNEEPCFAKFAIDVDDVGGDWPADDFKFNEGLNGFYKGLPPLWFRQVPYTMVKFAGFENTIKAFYTHVFTDPKDSYSKPTQLMITFLSGYIAGVMCAIVSHPADTIVSIMNKNPSKGSTFSQM